MSPIKKISVGTLAACAMVLAGCAHSTTMNDELKPSVSVSATQKVLNTGDSTTVMARTKNLAAHSSIMWEVSPTTAKISADSSDPSGLTERFSASEPGTYIVKAIAKAADGTTTSDETNIIVNGPMPKQ